MGGYEAQMRGLDALRLPAREGRAEVDPPARGGKIDTVSPSLRIVPSGACRPFTSKMLGRSAGIPNWFMTSRTVAPSLTSMTAFRFCAPGRQVLR